MKHILPIGIFCFCLCAPLNSSAQSKEETHVRSLNGTYRLNLSDSDECGTITVHIRRTPDTDLTDYDAWRANGTIKVGLYNRFVTFSGALVRIEPDGDVRVIAACVDFTIGKDGRLLMFAEPYGRLYYRVQKPKPNSSQVIFQRRP